MDIHEQAELVAAAAKALARPDHFLNYGNPELFKTWGPVIGQHRDSTARERSNFRVLVGFVEGLSDNHNALDAAMTMPNTDGCRRFVRREDESDTAEVFETARSSHFLVGWVEELNLRILVDPRRPVAPDNITRIFAEVVALLAQAEESGVIDQDDLDELEQEERQDLFHQLVDQINRGSSPYSDMPESLTTVMGIDRLYAYACEHFEIDDLDDVTESLVEAAIYCQVEYWAYAEYAHVYRNQLALF